MAALPHERDRTLQPERQAPLPSLPPAEAARGDAKRAAVPSWANEPVLVRLEAQCELRREHFGHCHHHVHDQKRWEVVHRERRDLHPSSRVLLSGDGRTEIRTAHYSREVSHCYDGIDV